MHKPMSLLRMFAPAQPPPARFPEGRVGYAVGDIHGRADLLALLLDRLEAAADADRGAGGEPIVVFLGDYVDRGPQSAQVIDLLLSGRPRGFVRRFLRGNHEQAMLAFMADPLPHRAWLMQGGSETLLSYGVTPPAPVYALEADWLEVAAQLRAAVPPVHIAFLEGLERFAEYGDYAFVHAGVDAARPLHAQAEADLYWIRERFLNSRRRFSHLVVHGHTPAERPYADQRRIGVDTGAYASGVLTAVRLEGEGHAFLAVSEKERSAASPPADQTVQF